MNINTFILILCAGGFTFCFIKYCISENNSKIRKYIWVIGLLASINILFSIFISWFWHKEVIETFMKTLPKEYNSSQLKELYSQFTAELNALLQMR
jgi:hypothetical protein